MRCSCAAFVCPACDCECCSCVLKLCFDKTDQVGFCQYTAYLCDWLVLSNSGCMQMKKNGCILLTHMTEACPVSAPKTIMIITGEKK